MWTKAKDNALRHRASTTVIATTGLTVDDQTAYRDQLRQLREENTALQEALDEVRL